MTAVGEADGADPSAARVPRLKPDSYYLAMRAYQKARILTSRMGGRPEPWQGVRIVGYHRVTRESDVLAVTPDQFRSHLELLLEGAAEPISLGSALEMLERPVSGRFACITFDDAFADVATDAAPILREYGIPATTFASTAIIDGTSAYTWYRGQAPPALTWDEIDDLVADGTFDVQSHTRTHPRLPALSDERASDEILGSKLDLERRLAKPVTSFCYPAGLYSQRDVAIVHSAGYRAGVTTRAGVNRGGQPMGELRRTMAGWREDRADFGAKLAGRLDRPAAVTEWAQRRRARAGQRDRARAEE